MSLTLVILAGGISSRYGRPKQLESVGPHGATIMDYSIYDALRAGFTDIVVVVQPGMEQIFQASIDAKYERRVPVTLATQRPDVPESGYLVRRARTKPWGTAHAVLSASSAVRGDFAVVNADDFYGAGTYLTLHDFLTRDRTGGLPCYAVVGFALCETLTSSGAVNRAVCRCQGGQWLERIEEVINIEMVGKDARVSDGRGGGRSISGDALVSMNAWGFRHSIFDKLRMRFSSFLSANPDLSACEFMLPFVVQDLVSSAEVMVKVLPSNSRWFGLTYPGDRRLVAEAIRGLTDAGHYPERLWGER